MILRFSIAALGACLAASALSPACADVLEIGSEGAARWIAGPQVSQPAGEASPLAEVPAEVVVPDRAVAQPSVHAAVVPAAYSAKVAELAARFASPSLDRDGLEALVEGFIAAAKVGRLGGFPRSAYSVSKIALNAYTRLLARELAGRGIKVNAVCPGTIFETGMRDFADKLSAEKNLSTAKERAKAIPMGRVGKPEDISRVVAFLASDEADYMTGQSINVTGGLLMH